MHLVLNMNGKQDPYQYGPHKLLLVVVVGPLLVEHELVNTLQFAHALEDLAFHSLCLIGAAERNHFRHVVLARFYLPEHTFI